MTSKPEREVDARLADWVDGRLSERERERFVAELRVSPQLRKDLEDYEKTVAAVRAALQAPARPVQVAHRVMAAIAAGGVRSSVGPRWRNRSFLWSLASAAALLVLALLVNTWSPAPATGTTASLDAEKSEMKADGKQGASDDLRKAREFHAVGQVERADRERLEKVAVEEQARDTGTNPAPPSTLQAPTAPAARAAAREPAPAEGTESLVDRAAQGKPAVPAAKAQPANDPAALSGDAGAKQAEVGGAQPGPEAPVEQDLVTVGAWGEQLPVVVVHGSSLVADHTNTESRLQGGKAVPPGSSTREAGRQVPPVQPGADAPPSGAPGLGTAMGKVAEATELPQQLEVFFKRQMTVASGADPGGASWSAGGLQFTPLHDAAAFAIGNDRGEAKAPGEDAKERSRAGVSGKDSVALQERGWLVEGNREDLARMLRQLSQFARASDLQLKTGWTSEAVLPPRSAPEGAVRQSSDEDKPKDKAAPQRPELTRSRLVLRFSAQPR